MLFQVIIDKEGLWRLEHLLRKKDKYYVMDPCWILSNITPRKEIHIEVVLNLLVYFVKLQDILEHGRQFFLYDVCSLNAHRFSCIVLV